MLALLRKPMWWRWNHRFHIDAETQLGPPSELPHEYTLNFPQECVGLAAPMLKGGALELQGLSARTRMGDLLGVIQKDGKVAHRSLVQTSGTAAMEGDARAIELQPGQYYIHWCETVPEEGGRGLYAAMLRQIVAHCRKQNGFREVIICCRQDNAASIKGILKAGFGYQRSSLAVSFLSGRLSFSIWYRAGRPPGN